jgi:eukaryotic-like serine/threonine-protein kinase
MSTATTSLPINSPTKAPLRHIGRFTVTDKIGVGSNGSVLLGHDPIIDRAVAIKVLNNPVGSIDRKQREQQFINEARAAGRLSHPNIVTIYDASTEGGTTFIAMEFLQGKDLRALLSSGRSFDVLDVANIIHQVANALAYAHSQNVIHRDIKPANIFILENNQPKVVDFGIARVPNRVLDDKGQPQTLFKNNIMGTPNYMSPEQASSLPVTASTDVYSLGAVLYELLTEKKPFSASSFEKLLNNILHKVPRAPHKIDPDISEKLSYITMKALQKKPEKRFQDAAEMAAALNKFIVHEKRQRRNNKHGKLSSTHAFSLANRGREFWISCLALVIALVLVVFAYMN